MIIKEFGQKPTIIGTSLTNTVGNLSINIVKKNYIYTINYLYRRLIFFYNDFKYLKVCFK